MPLHVTALAVSSGCIDHAVNSDHIPGNFLRPRELKHARTKLIVHQIIVFELAPEFVSNFTFEQILDDFGLANIGYRNNLDVVIFQREVIQVPTDLSQAHNANTDLSVAHLALPPVPKKSVSWNDALYPSFDETNRFFRCLAEILPRSSRARFVVLPRSEE